MIEPFLAERAKTPGQSLRKLSILAPLCSVLAAGLVMAQPCRANEPGVIKPGLSFDSDSLKVTGSQAWCWLSIPDSRLVLNPVTKVVDGVNPNRDNLSLHAGYFVGAGAVRLSDLISVETGAETPVTQTWWPYKLGLSAVVKGSGMKIQATDFLANEQTILRVMEFLPGERKPDASIPKLSGQVTGKASLPSPDVLLADGGEWFSATCLATVGSMGERPTALTQAFKIEHSRWSADISALPAGKTVVLVSMAFATKAEGAELAVQRAKKALLERPVSEWLADRKQDWDRLLAKVPHPARFGIGANKELPAEIHRQWYYGAWSFLLSQLLAPLPENGYPYYSVAEGKPSLWAEGDPAALISIMCP